MDRGSQMEEATQPQDHLHSSFAVLLRDPRTGFGTWCEAAVPSSWVGVEEKTVGI